MTDTLEVWQVGRTLRTEQTVRWTPDHLASNEWEEGRRIFIGFTAEDAGRSRRMLAVCETPEQAADLVRIHNTAHAAIRADERERCREAIRDLPIHCAVADAIDAIDTMEKP